jgi:hypothetical protein
MLSIINNIPDIGEHPLIYVFEKMALTHNVDTLWLEFGVATGKSINYISKFTNYNVYGFDSFEGLPEAWRDFEIGKFTQNGILPIVNDNVKLIKGLFNDTLPEFIKSTNKKVSFIHMDADLYSSTKYVLETLKDYIDSNCVVVFDELVNYVGFDNEKGELKALYEFIKDNNVKYEWIGMNGTITSGNYYRHQPVALIIRSVN